MIRKYRRSRGGFRYGRKTGKRVSTPGEKVIGRSSRRKGTRKRTRRRRSRSRSRR